MAFARMFGSSARVVSVEEEEGGKGNYTVQAWTGEGAPSGGSGTDAPPEAFVQRIEHPGGDVVVSPILEALRVWLRKGRDGQADAPAEADAGMVSDSAQKQQGASEGGRE